MVAHGLAARVADFEAEAAAAWGPLAEWARWGLRAVRAERERRARNAGSGTQGAGCGR